MPFTTIKSIAKVGLELFKGKVWAVELTCTILAAPPNLLDGLELGAVRQG
jgi:hypothetical protein